MSDVIGEAVLALSTQGRELFQGISKAKVEADALQDHFEKVGQAIRNALAIAGVGFGIREMVAETVASEDAQRNLESAVLATGRAAGFSADQLKLQAGALQEASRFGDEAIMGMQAQLLAFRNIQGDVFLKTQQAVLDFAAATGRDATDAARTLGMALNDPLTGMTMLRRAGVSLDAQVQSQIRTLAEHGRVVEAQNILINEFAKVYGGRAKASVNSLGGALDQFKNKFGDLFLEMRGPMRDNLVSFIQFITKNLGNIFAFLTGMFVTFKSVVESIVETLFYFGQAAVRIFSRDFKGAIESAGNGLVSFAMWSVKAGVAGTEAFEQQKKAIQDADAAMKSAAATTPSMAAGIKNITEKSLEMAKTIEEAVAKANLAVTQATAATLQHADESYATLLARAQNAAVEASANWQYYLKNIEAGHVELANLQAQAAMQASERSQKYAAAAVAAQARVTAQLKAMQVQSASTIGSLTADLLKGQMSFQQFAQRVVQELTLVIAKMLILKSLGGGIAGGFAGGLAGGLFGGGRAAGGPVAGGTTYLVGESGPELFTPDRSGSIVPNDQLQGRGAASVTINQTITGVDFGDERTIRRVASGLAETTRRGTAEGLTLSNAMTEKADGRAR